MRRVPSLRGSGRDQIVVALRGWRLGSLHTLDVAAHERTVARPMSPLDTLVAVSTEADYFKDAVRSEGDDEIVILKPLKKRRVARKLVTKARSDTLEVAELLLGASASH